MRRTPHPGQEDPRSLAEQACPWLGLADDPATRAQIPTQAHACCREDQNLFAIPEQHQVRYCLSAEHEGCAAYRSGWSSVRARDEHRRLPHGVARIDGRRSRSRQLAIIAGSAASIFLVVFLVAYAALTRV
ncbi:MAG TPA: hypothetical protein VIK11_06770 [Tepidiformaceae bacterium]